MAGVLRHFIEGAALSRPRSAGVPEEWLEQLAPPVVSIDPEALAAAYRRAVMPPDPPPRVDVSHITPITATVSAAVAELVSVLPDRRRITFRRLTEGIADRVEVIVRFLAVSGVGEAGSGRYPPARGIRRHHRAVDRPGRVGRDGGGRRRL